MSRALTTLCVLSLSAVLWSSATHAADICGSVWSGGRPVSGAQVLASAEGVIATTDDDGNFCLRDLYSELQKLQILALGFSRLERWVQYAPDRAPVRLELTPLRSLSFSGSGSATPSDKPPSHAPYPPQGDFKRQVALALEQSNLPELKTLMFPGDTSWIETAPQGDGWNSLLELEKTVWWDAPGESNPALYWKQVSAWAMELEKRLCGGGGAGAATRKSADALVSTPCDFLLRAQCAALVRTYLAGGEEVKSELRSSLDRLFSSRDEREREWGGELLDRLEELQVQGDLCGVDLRPTLRQHGITGSTQGIG